MLLANTNVHMVERAPSNGCCQLLRSPGWVPVVFCLSGRVSRISRWVWPRLLSNDCFCPGSQSVWDFVCVFEEWSLYLPQPSGLVTVSPTGVQSQMFWGFNVFPGTGSQGWGACCGSWTCGSLWRTSAVVMWVAPQGYGSWLCCSSTPPTHLVIPSL